MVVDLIRHFHSSSQFVLLQEDKWQQKIMNHSGVNENQEWSMHQTESFQNVHTA